MLTTTLRYFPNVKKSFFILSAACLFLLALLVFTLLIFKTGILTGFFSPLCLSDAAFHAKTFDVMTAVPHCWLIR